MLTLFQELIIECMVFKVFALLWRDKKKRLSDIRQSLFLQKQFVIP